MAFLLNPATNFLGDVLYISYYNNINTCMNYCACWEYNGMLKWFLFPMPIGVLLHGARYWALTTNPPAEITCP